MAVTLYDERRDYNFRKWLINSGKDLSENQYSQRYGFSDAKFEQAKARQLDLLAAVDRFLRSWNCRAVLLRRYFGEEPGQPCGNCDNCLQAKVARPAGHFMSAPRASFVVQDGEGHAGGLRAVGAAQAASC